MRRPNWFVPLLSLVLILGAGCREQTTSDGRAPDGDRKGANKKIVLPDPLPLPTEPRAGSWIAEPSSAASMVAPYSPVPIDLRVIAEQALTPLTDPALAAELARALDLRAPFGHVMLDDGQEVIRIGIDADARKSLAGRLAEFEPVGEFGAVRLPRPAGEEVQRAGTREWLVWIDEADGGSLALANSLEGLVTARMLGPTYGTEPIWFTADENLFSMLELPFEIPFSRVKGHGTLDKLEIEAQAIQGSDPLANAPFTTGTLGGLLEDPALAVGGSTRYADYQDEVHNITSAVNAQVRELPFLVKGIGEDLAAKLNTTLRTWDGRVLVAIGPANHIRIAYGANDVKKSGVAALRLLQSVVDNVSLARNFVSQLPKISLRRRVASADGVDIELFVINNAASLEPQLRPLVDKEGRLNLAMAWSERAGGGVMVVGPSAVSQLSSWLEATTASPRHGLTAEHLFAARFAVPPEQLLPLISNVQPELSELLALSASGAPWHAIVQAQEGGRYMIEIRTPGPPKPARAQTR